MEKQNNKHLDRWYQNEIDSLLLVYMDDADNNNNDRNNNSQNKITNI